MSLAKLSKSIGAAFGLAEDDQDIGFKLNDIAHNVKNAAGGANAAITIHRIFTNPFDFHLRLVSLKWSPDANVAIDATNYATYNFSKDDGAGAASVAAAALNTSNVAYVGNVAYATVLTAANCVLAPGASLYRAVAKAGTFTIGADMVAARFRRASSTD